MASDTCQAHAEGLTHIMLLNLQDGFVCKLFLLRLAFDMEPKLFEAKHHVKLTKKAEKNPHL